MMQQAARSHLPMTKMRAGVVCRQPVSFTPKQVTAFSPAIDVMTDLRRVPAATIRIDATLAQANQIMIARSVRLLLVLGQSDAIEGLITARDTMGERPINLLREQGGTHGELRVADLMVARDDIDVLDIATVMRARVGEIIALLKALGRQHALVVDRDPASGEEYARGVFSATQIGRHLGVIIPIFEVSKTFAQIEAELAR